MKFPIASLSLAALSTCAALSLVRVTPAQAAPPPYTIDAVHSTALFRVKHLNTSWAYGRFNGIAGTVAYDAAAPESSSIQIKVDANTVDTGNEKRDAHLKGADFFEVAKYPEIAFTSTSVKKAGDAALDVTGNLTLHGVTKPVTIRVDVSGSGKGRDGEALIGFETTFTVKRSDYGMAYGVPNLGDEVRMTIAVEASRK